MLDNYRKVPKVPIALFARVAKTCIVHGPHEVTGDNNIATTVKTSTFFIWKNLFHVAAF